MGILTKATVLACLAVTSERRQELNRNWQAINVQTPREAFCMVATNVATAPEIEGEDHIRPDAWESKAFITDSSLMVEWSLD